MEQARVREEREIVLQASAGVQTPRCRLSSLKPAQVASSREAYAAYVLWIYDGYFMGYNLTRKAFCSNTLNPAQGHAPEIWSSDGLTVQECQQECTKRHPTCTCFDFDNSTAPFDTCGLADFTTNLTGVECMGLTDPDDKAITPEACATACCAKEGCEVWQLKADQGCWLGILDQGGQSCVKQSGWMGGARPSPNQMFSLMTGERSMH
jgi:hypothetical protein